MKFIYFTKDLFIRLDLFQNIDYLIYIAECIEIFKVYDTKDIRCKDIRSRKLEHENSNHQFWN